MAPPENACPSVLTVIRELQALRARVEQAPDWLRDPETTMTAAALAREVEGLCRKTALCRDDLEAESFLAESGRLLDRLQTLLGVH